MGSKSGSERTISSSDASEAHPALQALLLAKEGQWDEAHNIVQSAHDARSALVHAYLHRKEGDEWNARYWYNQAGRKPFLGTLEEEWRALVNEFSLGGR